MQSIDITDTQVLTLRAEASAAGAAGDDITVLLCACAVGDMDEAMEDYEDVVSYDRIVADYYPAYQDAAPRFHALQVQSMDHARRLLTLQLERALGEAV